MWYSDPYEISTDQRVPLGDISDGNIVILSIVLGIFIIGIIVTIICYTKEAASSRQRNKCCTCCGCIDGDRRLKLVSPEMDLREFSSCISPEISPVSVAIV